MENSQKGFVTFLIIAIIALLAIGGGLYYYSTQTSKSEIKTETQNTTREKEVDIPIDNSTQNGTDNNQNLNLGTITIRVIVANIDEVGNKYGLNGMKFSQSKLGEADQAIQKLNTFVKQSSYGKAQLQWQTSGVYELGNGVCNHTSYGDKVNDLIQRALVAADSQNQLVDYSHYLIVHPMPDCPDGITWSYEGNAKFTSYTLNGRVVNLRGVRISDLGDHYLFHEFGHSLGYQPNKGIGHPDYLNCPITTSVNATTIIISDTCPRMFDFYSRAVPIFTIMSAQPGNLSDYNAIEKEIIGWLVSQDIITTSNGQYTLSPLEQAGSGPKALKIPISGSSFNVYVSFRQPVGFSYPSTLENKPNGVIFDITDASNISNQHYLVTNSKNLDAPLRIGIPYRLGANGPFVTVNSISNNRASVTVSGQVP